MELDELALGLDIVHDPLGGRHDLLPEHLVGEEAPPLGAPVIVIEHAIHHAVVFKDLLADLDLVIRHLLEKLLQQLRLLIEGQQALVKGHHLMEPLKHALGTLEDMGAVRV